MQVLLFSIIALLIGVIVGSAVTYYLLERSQQQAIVKDYEVKIQDLKLEQQKAIKEARAKSTDTSRSVIKGKIAEQLAPLLPGFQYLPSDARFMGDPIDYVVFNGYTNIKDGAGSSDQLEIVILDVKSGKATLSATQKAIAQAVEAGRVRFETVRINLDQPQEALEPASHQKPLEPTPTTYKDAIRQQYPRAYTPWSQDEDQQLRLRHQQQASIKTLATEFQRQPSAIQSRLRKLGLV